MRSTGTAGAAAALRPEAMAGCGALIIKRNRPFGGALPRFGGLTRRGKGAILIGVKSDDGEEAVLPRPKRGASRLKAPCRRYRPVPLPSGLRGAGRGLPVTAVTSDGVCRISSADTALQKLEIQTVFLRSCALSQRKISRHPQRTVKTLRVP